MHRINNTHDEETKRLPSLHSENASQRHRKHKPAGDLFADPLGRAPLDRPNSGEQASRNETLEKSLGNSGLSRSLIVDTR